MDKKTTDYRYRSLGYIDQFKQQNFDTFLSHLSRDYSGQLPKEGFGAQWGQIIQAFGELQQILQSDVSYEEGCTAVTVTTLHILRKLILTFVYDADGAIVRTAFKMAPLDVVPQKSDYWQEQPIQVGCSEKKLNGMLTIPNGIQMPPVMILLQGSGPNNMNEQVGIGGNMPFADLAHGLAEQGIATIRYDKRTYAYPEDMIYADIEAEYLNDAGDAVRLALQDGRVDKSQIFLLGHSEGGMVGPEVIRRNPEIIGFISLAGTLRHLEDIILEQTKKILADSAALSEEQKQAQLEIVEQSVCQIKALKAEDQTSMIMGASAAYWNSLNAIAPSMLVKQLDIPMLIVQGEEDFQVLVETDYRLWQETLAGKPNVTYKLYPALNHLLMTGGNKEHIDLSVYNTPGHMDTQVILDLAAWIKTVLKQGIITQQ